MIKQNIKVALLSILFLVVFWLIMFSFIKIDVGSKAIITFDNTYSYIAIDTANSSYIEKHEIDYVKMEYEKQYFDCHITYTSKVDDFQYYLISLPDIVDKTSNYIETNIIIDSLNIYQYLFKK